MLYAYYTLAYDPYPIRANLPGWTCAGPNSYGCHGLPEERTAPEEQTADKRIRRYSLLVELGVSLFGHRMTSCNRLKDQVK